MTTVTLKRSQSTSLQRTAPTKKAGSNAKTLPLFQNPKEIRDLLGFAFPAAVLAPGTQIVSAELRVRNYQPVPSSMTIVAARVLEKWSATNGTWDTRPTWDNTTDVATTKASSPKAGTWVFDVTDMVKQMQAAGKSYGIQLEQSAGYIQGTRILNYGSYVPTLKIVYSTGPALPTRLSPSNGQVVAAAKPMLRVTSAQLGEPIYQMNVQIDPAQDGVSPDFDSGWVDGSLAMIDTAAYGGAPTMTPGSAQSWRVRVRDIDGTTTAWTSWQTYTYQPLGTLTIVEPAVAPGNVVTDPTPPIIWDFTGQTQAAYRVTVIDLEDPAGTLPLWDSGIVTSTDETTTPEVDVATEVGKLYRVTVTIYDTYPRAAGSGEVGVFAYRDFTFELSAGVDPVVGFTLEDMDPLPFVKLLFSDPTPADGYQVVRDGVSLGVFDAADLLVSGDDYEFVDHLANPRREHTWVVRRIVNGETSATNTSQSMVINPGGLWLSQPDRDRYLPFITNGGQAVGLSEDGGTFFPLNAEFGARVTGSLRGWSGTVAGEILATPLTEGATGSELRDMFLAMRKDTGAPMVLTLLDLNLKVVAFNMSVAPTPTIGKNEDYVYLASIEFIEVP